MNACDLSSITLFKFEKLFKYMSFRIKDEFLLFEIKMIQNSFIRSLVCESFESFQQLGEQLLQQGNAVEENELPALRDYMSRRLVGNLVNFIIRFLTDEFLCHALHKEHTQAFIHQGMSLDS